MTTVEVFAPAKINLALHVTGQLDNGYHLLDTLVAFADIGDTVRLHDNGPAQLQVTGPEGLPELASDHNIMWMAAQRFWAPDRLLSMALEKRLPMASGIGGGSADAAATFRGLLLLRASVEGRKTPRDITEEDADKLLGIGADVPMCVLSEAARVRGIGEQIEPVVGFPALPVVLVNPRVNVSTPAVFSNLTSKDNKGMAPWPVDFQDGDQLITWLHAQRNDLQDTAVANCPAIGTVLQELSGNSACRLARMSGSGATCFGLYDTQSGAQVAADELRSAHPDWWIQSGTLNGGDMCAPQLIRSTT